MRAGALRSCALLALLATAEHAGGQGTAPVPAHVTGTVLDTAQMPIAGAIVELLSLGQTRSDSGGGFRFAGVPPGSVILRVAKIGLRPVMKSIRVAAGDSIDLDVTLEPSAYQLTTMVIHRDSSFTFRTDPTGFQRRRANGQGRYITADEIAHSRFTETSQLLRSVPGVSVNAEGGIVIERGAMTLKDGTQCGSALVFVDGVANPAFNVNEISIASIRGIEVYSGPATTPVELRSSRTVCGTVAIWTR